MALCALACRCQRSLHRPSPTSSMHGPRPLTQEFLEANGPLLPDGSRDDPPLPKFEEQIQKYK
jgi:hypothetical protein